MIIKAEHGFAIGYCAKGMRKFCMDHGIDYMQFFHEGVEETVFLETQDPMAIHLVEATHGRSKETNDRL